MFLSIRRKLLHKKIKSKLLIIFTILLTSVALALICTSIGIIRASTTVGTNITTTGTLTAQNLTTLTNASSSLLSVSGITYIGGSNGLILADGSITDVSGSIDFGNENLSTTGNIGIGTSSSSAELEISSASPSIIFTDSTANSDDYSINIGANNFAITNNSKLFNVFSYNSDSATTYSNSGIAKTDADILIISNNTNDGSGVVGQDGAGIIIDEAGGWEGEDFRLNWDGNNAWLNFQTGNVSTNTWSTDAILNIGGFLFGGGAQQGITVDSGTLRVYENQDLRIWTDTTYFRSNNPADNTANIGINIDPAALTNSLSIAGIDNTGDTSLRIYEDTDTGSKYFNIYTDADGNLKFKNDSGANAFTILNDNNVGIGATSPTAKLEVDGIIKTSPRSSATCDANAEGGIYYDSDDNNFYGCNGSSWVQLNN